MDCSNLRELLLGTVAAQWACEALPDGRFLIGAPVSYRDGDHPEMLAYIGEGEIVTLSDYGSVTARLTLHDAKPETGRVHAEIRMTSRDFGLQYLADGQLQTQVSLSDFGPALLNMASAMLQIDALAALRVTQRGPLFGGVLANWLDLQLPGRVRSRAKVAGHYGKVHQLTAAVSSPVMDEIYVQAIAGPTAEPKSLEHAFRIFHDIEPENPQRKISVLADLPDYYDDADLKILKEVSYVATWRQRDRMIRYIGVGPDSAADRELYELVAPPLG